MSNVVICVNEALLNQLLKPEYFTGEREIASVIIRYYTDIVPYFILPEDDTEQQQFIIMLEAFTVTLSRQGKSIATETFNLTLKGQFNFIDNRITITFEHAQVKGGGRIARNLLNTYLNKAIIPAIREHITLPDLRQLVGFPVTVDEVSTHNRMLFMTMHVSDDQQPPTIVIKHTDEPSIFLAATGNALTQSQRAFSIKQGIDQDTNLPLGLSLGIAKFHLMGYMEASDLQINIKGGAPVCHVNFTASAGMRVKFNHMGTLNLALSPTITPPAISLDLKVDRPGTCLWAAMQVNSDAIIGWRIPLIPMPIRLLTDEIMSWVDVSMGVVIDTIDAGLRTLRIPVFSLDSFSDSIGLPLRFQSVGFRGNSIVVHVQVCLL